MARFQAKNAGKVLSLLLSLIAICAIATSGCGSDGGNTAKGNVMPAPSTTKVNIIHKIVSRSLDSKVASIEITAFDGKGVPQIDPYTTAKRSEINLDVPVTAKSMRLVYLDSSKKAIGIFVKPVQLKVKEEYTIEDPDWEDADSQTCFTGIRLNPNAAKVKVGEMVRLEAFGQFEAEGTAFEQSISNEAEWEAYNDKYVTNKQKGLFVGAAAGETKVIAYYFNQIATGDVTVFDPDSEDFYVEKDLTRVIEIPMDYELKDTVEAKLRLSDGSIDNAFKYPVTSYSVEDSSVIAVEEETEEVEIDHEIVTIIKALIVKPRALGESTLTLTHTEEGKEFADIVISYKVTDETLKYIMTNTNEVELIKGRGYKPDLTGFFNETCSWDVFHLREKDPISSDPPVLMARYDMMSGKFVDFIGVEPGTATITLYPPEGIKFMDEDDQVYDEWQVLVTVKPAVIDHIEGNFPPGDERTIKVDDTITFTVTAVWSDDTEESPHKTDVTNECTFTSSKPAVLEFSSLTPNVATGKSPGVSVVNCIYGSAFEPIRYVITVEQ